MFTFGFQGDGLRVLAGGRFVSGSNSNDDVVKVKLDTWNVSIKHWVCSHASCALTHHFHCFSLVCWHPNISSKEIPAEVGVTSDLTPWCVSLWCRGFFPSMPLLQPTASHCGLFFCILGRIFRLVHQGWSHQLGHPHRLVARKPWLCCHRRRSWRRWSLELWELKQGPKTKVIDYFLQ